MNFPASKTEQRPGPLPEMTPTARRTPNKRVRIIKKLRLEDGVWKFISLDRAGSRYVWDARPGYYFVEWWEGRKRRRERAGDTHSEALEAQRRKRNELIGELVSGASRVNPLDATRIGTTVADAARLFAEHVRTHSPSKPRTLERYQEVLAHFARILANKKYVEAITRSDIDDYKVARSRETVGPLSRPVSPATVNFEVTVLKTFFYYLIRERGIAMENPCARSKPLRAEKECLKRRPPTYTQAETDKILAACGKMDRAIFATLLLTGLRKEELGHLAWSDLDLLRATLRLTAKDAFDGELKTLLPTNPMRAYRRMLFVSSPFRSTRPQPPLPSRCTGWWARESRPGSACGPRKLLLWTPRPMTWSTFSSRSVAYQSHGST